MKCRYALLATVITFLFSISSYAVELGVISPGFPAAQKPAFTKERTALVAEKKALDSRVARYNRTCAKPKPQQVHKCGVDRLEVYKLVDGYKLKVQDFNKRLIKVDKGQDAKTDEVESEDAALGGSLKK